ncbi:MAG: T9SS type A sorting domain-containing protein [Chitinophagaceae bacterium]
MKSLFFLLSSIVLSVLITTTGFSQPISQTFNASGTYTVPAGYSALLTIEAWGAGGGAGSGSGAKAGGGGGAYSTITVTLTAGSYSVVVGVGGTPGVAGTASTFSNLTPSVILSAGGGGSTAGATPGGVGGVVITGTGFSGGAGGVGATTTGVRPGGGGGGSAFTGSAGPAGAAGIAGGSGGAGGAGTGGGGRGADDGGAPDGIAGAVPGGGGGGRGNSGGTSKAGAAGRVIVTVNTVLPVKLSNIKAYEKQNGIQIEWTAYAEIRLDKYQVERSENGSVFSPIAEVAATNSLVETRYGFFDPNPLPGVSYYRLKSVDIDGRTGFSNIVKVNLDKNIKGIVLYPNPVTTGYVSFQSSDLERGNYSVRVFNAGGQQVYSQRFIHTGGAINQTIQLPGGIKPGLYNIQLESDIVKVMNKTFMVQ